MRDNTGSRLLRSPLDPERIEYGVASSIVVGALSLVDPARLGPGPRLAFRAVTAVITGGLTFLELKRTEALHDEILVRAAAAVGVAGTVFGLSDVSEKIDARITSGLRKAGVRRPRLLLAVASTLTSIAAFRSSDRVGSPWQSPYEWRADPRDDRDDAPRHADVDPAVRDLVDGILSETTAYSAEDLRRQWATAQAEYWPTEDTAVFDGQVVISVDEATPRVVPYDFTFPVRAQFRTPSGILAEASVVVSGGRLRAVVITVADDAEPVDFDEDPLDDLTGWPAVAEVIFVADTP